MTLRNIFNKRSLTTALGVAGTAAGLAITGAAIVGGSFFTVPLAAGMTAFTGYKLAKHLKQPKA